MKRLLGDKYSSFDTTLFTCLFYQRNLFSVKDKLPLPDLAQLADDCMDSVPMPSVANITSSSETQQLAHLFTRLTMKVNALEERLNDPRRHHSTSPCRFRSRGGPTHTPGICYYYNRFGSDAIKCTKLCSFTNQPLNQNSGC